MKKNKKILLIFSGGQDSTTCLYWAKKKFSEVECLFFNYGQKHKIELESAKKISKLANVKLHILDIPTFQQIGNSSLTNSELKNPTGEVKENKIPISFVPGRNIIFISFAAAFCYDKNINNIVTGVCQADYSNYPDCREIFIKSLNKTINLGMENNFKIHTPLMNLTKSGIVKLAYDLNAYDIMAYTHTCYNGKEKPCGICPACILRAKGFKQANLEDPKMKLYS